MVTYFVRQHVGLRELPRSCEAVTQLLKKSQVDVDFLILGAIKRPSCGLRRAAPGLCEVGEQHKFGVVVWRACLRKQLLPSVLHVVQHEGDELDPAALGGVGIRVRQRPYGGRGIGCPAATQHGKQVGSKHETQHNQHQRAAYAEMHAVESAEIGPAAAFAAPVLDIRTVAAWCPLHALPEARRAPTCEECHFLEARSELRSGPQGGALCRFSACELPVPPRR